MKTRKTKTLKIKNFGIWAELNLDPRSQHVGLGYAFYPKYKSFGLQLLVFELGFEYGRVLSAFDEE